MPTLTIDIKRDRALCDGGLNIDALDDEVADHVAQVFCKGWKRLTQKIEPVLELSIRARNALVKNNVSTVLDVIRLTKNDVKNLRGVGTTVRAEVYNHMDEIMGIELPNWQPDLEGKGAPCRKPN